MEVNCGVLCRRLPDPTALDFDSVPFLKLFYFFGSQKDRSADHVAISISPNVQFVFVDLSFTSVIQRLRVLMQSKYSLRAFSRSTRV